MRAKKIKFKLPSKGPDGERADNHPGLDPSTDKKRGWTAMAFTPFSSDSRLITDSALTADGRSSASTVSDDYGFLSFNGNRKDVRITLTPHSPNHEVDYFDESLFTINAPSASLPNSGAGSIPLTLGTISSQGRSARPSGMINAPAVVSSRRSADRNSTASVENTYQNVQGWGRDDHRTDFYHEISEDHYAKLSDLKPAASAAAAAASQDSQSQPECRLSFYEQRAAEQRTRSQTRNSDGRRARSRSARSGSRAGARSRSRGRSASRDIMALYTSGTPSAGRSLNGGVADEQRPPNNNNHLSGAATKPAAAQPKRSSDAQSSGRQGGRRSGSPRTRRSRSRPSTPSDNQTTMAILEMDVERNYQIEKTLLAASGAKPASIRMMMVAGHTPDDRHWAAKDEIAVKAGQLVVAQYKQNEWLFVSMEEEGRQRRGFVPYAYAKPLKMAGGAEVKGARTSQKKAAPLSAKPDKPLAGILKTSHSKQQKQRRSAPKYSVKVRTAADNDSLSSETSSAIMEDFVYTRVRSRLPDIHADCIVINTDGGDAKMADNNNRRSHLEETGTYSSDSGFSDPHSQHGDDSDLLHSPLGSPGDDPKSHLLAFSKPTTRPPNEKIVGVTTKSLELNLTGKTSSSSFSTREVLSKGRYCASPTISDMPLGPLGARLAKIALEKKPEPLKEKKSIGADMRERARCSSTTPSSLRPEIPKDYNGPRVTVVFDYSVENDDDLDVKASDIVTVLNGEDIEWIWVQRRDGREGFIPRDYVIPLEISLQNNRRKVGVALL